MKLLFSALLCTILLSDFVSASYDYEITTGSNCESISSCENVDLHNSDETSHEHNEKNHHCHCHAGHSHIAVISFVNAKGGIYQHIEKTKFPAFNNKNIKNYVSEIIRPPIT